MTQHAPSLFTPANQGILLAMAEMGAGKEVLQALLELGGNEIRKDHLRFLLGPVVVHQSSWMDRIPNWLIQAVVPERLTIIFEEHERGEISWNVGPAEITAVMMPATMDAPLRLESSQIFLWASAHANARHQGKTTAEIWQELGGNTVEDAQVTQPSGLYYDDYQRLSSEIRRKVVNAQKSRERSQKGNIKSPSTLIEPI